MLPDSAIGVNRANASATAVKRSSDVATNSRTGRRLRQRLLRVEAGDDLPVTLKHERIYILPTARGFAFVAVSFVMILASMNYGLNLGYALSFILVGLFASCLLSTYLNLSQLTIQTIASSDTFAGAPVEYQIVLAEGRGKSRYSITVQAMGDTSTIDLPANGPSTAILRDSAVIRGEHKLGRITLSSDFPLGLWRGWGYVHAPTRTFVYPKPETPVAAFQFNKHNNTEGKTLIPEEREFDQLKRYQPTDTPSAVAWKAVAGGRGWFSKQFSSAEASRELEITWSGTEDLNDIEQRLSRVCAWIIKADATATPYKLEMPNGSTNSGYGPEHLKNCLRCLASFSAPVK